MTTDLYNLSDKVKLWTRQHKNVLKELEKYGVYRVKKEYILEKMDTISDYYLNLYEWYGRNAAKVVPKPEGVIYPIWLSISSDMMLQPTEDTIILEIEVDRKNVIYTDVDKWGYVVNYFYLPIDPEDEERHNEELKKFGISDESALITGDKGNFYPLLKNKIIKSWERLFEPLGEESTLVQATIWEIKKEWVVDIIHG
ncbi:DUF3841 domain-containing protein [Tissierella pigra]|uniref:DUF3841 domain-containing protein n=1 Tax=Tissierella pigra TaxID=2607614 RepID=A0A6N7XHX3_9FIRM|nr:DUF3841 domain-containing protein [Tissierella pigra]MBU5426273.1 DUF3841 domain-containing protein [Tissierella pigra]MSU01256.1 DUF3841 domain-containing protein [Tissierella pigra]